MDTTEEHAPEDRAPNGDFLPGNKIGASGGRPTKFNPITTNEICRRIIRGETLTRICKDEGMPAVDTVYQWLWREDEKYDGFRSDYARARKLQVKTWADMSMDTLLEVKDERQSHAIVTARKNVSDGLRWHISRLDPETYGEKSQVQHSGGIAVDVHVDRPPELDRAAWLNAHTPKAIDDKNNNECVDVTPSKEPAEVSACNDGESEGGTNAR